MRDIHRDIIFLKRNFYNLRVFNMHLLIDYEYFFSGVPHRIKAMIIRKFIQIGVMNLRNTNLQ